MKNILTCLFAALGLTTACGQQNFINMGVKEFAELIADSNVVILDVRKADEFAEGHIKGAVLIDQFQSDFVERLRLSYPRTRLSPSTAAVVAALLMPLVNWQMSAISV